MFSSSHLNSTHLILAPHTEAHSKPIFYGAAARPSRARLGNPSFSFWKSLHSASPYWKPTLSLFSANTRRAQGMRGSEIFHFPLGNPYIVDPHTEAHSTLIFCAPPASRGMRGSEILRFRYILPHTGADSKPIFCASAARPRRARLRNLSFSFWNFSQFGSPYCNPL